MVKGAKSLVLSRTWKPSEARISVMTWSIPLTTTMRCTKGGVSTPVAMSALGHGMTGFRPAYEPGRPDTARTALPSRYSGRGLRYRLVVAAAV
jgi:hypothetical protein